MSTMKTGGGNHLTINTIRRQLHHYNNNRLIKSYPVAVGKPATPTPAGRYRIINKIVNPGGLLGSRWMGLSIPGGNYGIHGTNNPGSINTAASLGCIRMHNHQVEELFSRLSIGTPVEITTQAAAPPKTVAVPMAAAPVEPADLEPPAAEQPSNAQPAADDNQNYTVKPGDTLWDIARKYGVSLSALIAANDLPRPDEISPGQIIIIP